MRGTPPKPPGTRARRNADPIPLHTVQQQRAPQPVLPVFAPDGESWNAQTVAWWEMWGRSPLTADFTENDWQELMDTATIHHRLWGGDAKAAAELRLRTAKHGATAEDRLRLRIQFAFADKTEAEAERAQGRAKRERTERAIPLGRERPGRNPEPGDEEQAG